MGKQMPTARTGFWVFVATPRAYPIDLFLRERLPRNKGISVWTVRGTDDLQQGDFGLVRVGTDGRTKALLKDDGAAKKLESGIYAVCEVLDRPSRTLTDKDADLWRSQESSSRATDLPKVPIKYLWSSLSAPLLLDELKINLPHLRNPTQGQYCFSISEDDFGNIVNLLPAKIRGEVNAIIHAPRSAR
jgi:hypothetical protein